MARSSGSNLAVNTRAGSAGGSRANIPRGLAYRLGSNVFFRLEREPARRFWCGSELTDVSPGLFVVGNYKLIHPCGNHIALHTRRVCKQHEGLFPLGALGRINHGLSRAVLVEHLD